MELEARRRQKGQSIQSLYQDVKCFMCLESPNEKDPTKLEDAVLSAVRYEALKAGSAKAIVSPQISSATTMDLASYVYDDKDK